VFVDRRVVWRVPVQKLFPIEIRTYLLLDNPISRIESAIFLSFFMPSCKLKGTFIQHTKHEWKEVKERRVVGGE
jgi:hypothetical protein